MEQSKKYPSRVVIKSIPIKIERMEFDLRVGTKVRKNIKVPKPEKDKKS
jgi:hypothetical protein